MHNELNNSLITVIIPVHNREDYVKQAIESVVNQTYKNIEIIVVHNESTDNTKAILDKLEAAYENVQVIHQKNQGYGKSINVGIAKASGEYIAILEADDWAQPQMYEKMLIKAKNTGADIVKCSFNYIKNEQATIIEECKYWYNIDKGMETFTIKQVPDIIRYFASLWTCLYKTSFLKENNIKMLETPEATYQDFSWMVNTYSKAKSITILKEPLYNYRRFPKKDTTSYYVNENVLYMPYHCFEARKILIDSELMQDVKEEFYIHAFRSCILFGNKLRSGLKRKYRKKFIELVKYSKIDKCEYKLFTNNDIIAVQKLLYDNFMSKMFLVTKSLDKSYLYIRFFGLKFNFSLK